MLRTGRSLALCFLLASAGCFSAADHQAAIAAQTQQSQQHAQQQQAAFMQQQQAQQAAATQAERDKPWSTMSQTSALDGSTNIVASKSGPIYQDWLGKHQVATFFVGCQERQLKIGVRASDFAHETIDYDKNGVRVTVRVGEETAHEVVAALGTDKVTAYLPDPSKLIGQLRASANVVVQFTPYRQNAMTVVFPTHDIAAALDQVERHCPAR